MDVWVEHEVEGGEFPDQRLKSRLGKLLGDWDGGSAIPFRPPAKTGRRRRPLIDSLATPESMKDHPGRSLCRDQGSVCRNPRLDSGPTRHDRVHLQARKARGDRSDTLDLSFSNRQPAHHRLRAADAFESGGDHRGTAAGVGGHQVLDPQEVQGDQCPEEERSIPRGSRSRRRRASAGWRT